MKYIYYIVTFIVFKNTLTAQSITGKIINRQTQKELSNVIVQIANTNLISKTNKNGKFLINENIPLGEQILTLQIEGYTNKKIPIIIEHNKFLELGIIELSINFKNNQQQFVTIDLAEHNQDNESQNQTILQAYKDPYLKSVAYNWSSTFFKVRGLGSEYSKILINGVEMNKLYNQRPNWSNWSGLNDILKSQETTNYIETSHLNFGDLNGTTNFNIHSGAFSKSKKISLSSTNRSYQGRIMGTYHSGIQPNNWAYSLSFSARKATEGHSEGTSLNTFSFFGGIERKINEKNNISLTFIYTPVERGKTSPNTKEVTDIKGIKYNSYWGFQNNKKRNSRIKKVKEPIITLSHYWTANKKITIQNNILIQKGSVSNSRVDYTGTSLVNVNNHFFYEGVGSNPDPTYYQKLPSYFLRESGSVNYESAYLAEQEFLNDGQIDWKFLYKANQISNENATYILYEDRNEDLLSAINSIIRYDFSNKLKFNGKIAYRYLNSHNYAKIIDLLGGNSFLDVDSFSSGSEAQNNLLTPNRLVGSDDRFKYNYNLLVKNYSAFAQVNYTYNKWDINTALSVEANNYQRDGNYENGHYTNNLSLGKSAIIYSKGLGIKTNLIYNLNPKISISSNLYLKEKLPNLKSSFTNARQNNQINTLVKNEINTSADLNFKYQYHGIKVRFSNYWIQRSNSTQNSFFYSQDIASLGRVDNADFFQELVYGSNIRNIGLEFGAEIDVTNTLSVQLSAAIGDHRYTNNPNLQITSDSQNTPIYSGPTFLKNYRLGNGPQQAYGFGFNYRDPSYWWFATQLNFYKNSYSNISSYNRTENFIKDIDGLTFTNYNEARRKELLKQEEFPSYFLWNAIGGKSWRIKGKYLGFTLGIQNILNIIYKTGGFEQSRNSNYKDLNEDRNREKPLFGSKYWHGTGTTFYANTFIRF